MRKRSISVLALVIAVIITAYFMVAMWATTSAFGDHVSADIFPAYDDTAFGGLFAQTYPDDNTLPHYLYQHIADSLKQANEERQLENRSVAMSGNAFGSLGMYTFETLKNSSEKKGKYHQIVDLLDSLTIAADKKIATLTNKDSIQRIKDQLQDTLAYFNRVSNEGGAIKEDAPCNLHYLSLQGYSLPREKKFFVQNGTYNLAVPKWDSIKKGRRDTWRYGHYERKQIPIRYSAENKMLLIPVSSQQFRFFSFILPALGCLVIAASIFFFVGLPIQILINISRGKAFNDKNVQRFNSIALVLLILTLGTILSPYILRLCFWKMIPDDFIFPGFWSKVWDKSELFIAVIVIFITGKAFQKGNKLQKEQDLTI